MPSSPAERVIPWPKYFLFLALGATIIGALLSSKTLFGIDKKIATAKDEARPANIKITKITAPTCADCFAADGAVAELKKQNVAVGEEQSLTFDSPEAQALIQKLGIKKVPTYIATGEITKKNLENFIKSNGEIKDDTFVFEQVTPIFIDPATKQELGLVKVAYLTDPSCAQCLKPELLIQSLTRAGVKIAVTTNVTWYSAAGQKIINQYKIKNVPTIVLSSALDYYDSIKAAWPQKIGTVESDGAYVARQLSFPYRDLQKNKIVGLVDVTYLTVAACKDCYKPQVTHKNVLMQGFGMALGKELTIDADSAAGKALIAKYKITQIPTLLISPSAADYTQLASIWPQVGTVETDGWYVFRKMEQIGVTYKDLTTNKIIQPASTQ